MEERRGEKGKEKTLALKAITIKVKRLRGKQGMLYAMADLLTTRKHAHLNAIPYCNCFLKVLTLVILIHRVTSR